MTEEKMIEDMAHTMCLLEEENCQECAKNNYPFIAVTDCDLVRRAKRLYAAGYRKQTVVEHICCKDCKHSECCVVQIRAYNEELDAELLPDPNDFYCAFAKMKGGDEQ